MDRLRNMLIGIVAGVLIVGTLSYATRVGEGDYDEAERLIQKLLAEKES